MHRLTASSLARARQCLYSFREDVPLAEDEKNAAGRVGSAFHELAECYLAGAETTVSRMAEKHGLSPSCATKLREMWHQWLGWWPNASGGHAWRPEVPFAADLDAGRATIVNMPGEREDNCPPHHLPGR